MFLILDLQDSSKRYSHEHHKRVGVRAFAGLVNSRNLRPSRALAPHDECVFKDENERVEFRRCANFIRPHFVPLEALQCCALVG